MKNNQVVVVVEGRRNALGFLEVQGTQQVEVKRPLKLKAWVKKTVSGIVIASSLVVTLVVGANHYAPNFETPVEQSIVWEGEKGTHNSIHEAIKAVNPNASNMQLQAAYDEFFVLNPIVKSELEAPIQAGDYLVPVIEGGKQ